MSTTRGRLRGKWTVVDGRSMFSRVTAADRARDYPPIVLVHGLVVSSSYMVPLAEELSRWFKVYAVDLPGYGRSFSDRILGLGELADALGHWVEAAGLSGPVMLGNSFGCQVLAEYAVRFRRQVRGFIFVGPTLDSEARSLPRLLGRWVSEAPHRESRMGHVMLRDYLSAGPRRSMATIRMMMDDSIDEKMPRIWEPVLLARGEHDPIAPQRWLEDLERITPHARLATIPGSAHPANYLAPEPLADIVRAFMDQVADTVKPGHVHGFRG